MTTDEEIDARLARISGRMAAQRASVRDRVAAAGWLPTLEALKETFGGPGFRLSWWRDAEGEVGVEPERGFVPADYTPKREGDVPVKLSASKPKGRKRKVSKPSRPGVTWHDRY